jgi:large subunit ribosomal protein L9
VVQVKVILKQDLPKLGKKGEVKEVAEGYARNMLFPRGLAEEATAQRMKELERRSLLQQSKNRRLETESLARAEQLNQQLLTFKLAAGEGGRLFGSVTAADIAEALHKQGYEVDKKKILLAEPIKAVGRHPVSIKLHQGVRAEITVQVEKEN